MKESFAIINLRGVFIAANLNCGWLHQRSTFLYTLYEFKNIFLIDEDSSLRTESFRMINSRRVFDIYFILALIKRLFALVNEFRNVPY